MALLVSGVYAVGAAPLLPTKQFLFSDAATYPTCDERVQDLNQLFRERPICKEKTGLMRNVSTEGSLENSPAMIVGDKATLPNLMAPLSCHSCVALQLLRGGKEMSGACPEAVGEAADEHAVLYRVSSYDACNPYESMHAHLNLFVAMERLKLKAKDIQILFKDDVKRSDSCSHEVDFWDRINPKKPPLYSSSMAYTGDKAKWSRERLSRPFRGTVVDAAHSGESLLCAKSSKGGEHFDPTGLLPGRNRDVQCQLPILRRFRDWNFELLKISGRLAQLALDGRAEDPQLLWISRSTSKSRYMVDEASRFEMLGVSLGVPITVLDVESYSLRKVAMLVQGVSVLAGAHGAGLAWLVFLRNPAAVVELFGGDRPSNNRHYHNMAVMLGLSYYELAASGTDANGGLECGEFGGESACAAALATTFRNALDTLGTREGGRGALALATTTEEEADTAQEPAAAERPRDARIVRFMHRADHLSDGRPLSRPCELLSAKPWVSCGMFYDPAPPEMELD